MASFEKLSLMTHGGVTALRCVVAVGLLGVFATQHSAQALEAGKTHYPLGVNTVVPGGLAPVSGETTIFDYNLWYTANESVGSKGQSILPGYQLNLYVNAVRILHTWVDLDGFRIGTQIAPTFNAVDIHVRGIHSDRGGLGDLNLAQYIQYDRGDFAAAFYANVWAPIGRYSPTDPASSGLNYWTFAPQTALSWLPQRGKYELSANAVSQFNTRNPSTHYRSGNSFDLDFTGGYRPFDSLPPLQFAAVGYVFTQWTDDRRNGVRVPGGNRGQVFAIGPQVRYYIGPIGLVLKWQHEFGVENLASGERFWLQFRVSL